MPISGAFVADFSAFVSAVTSAEVKLRSFETGSNAVERQLSKMTDSFTGRKVIQEAQLMVEAVNRVGGAAKLTETELSQVATKAEAARAKLVALGADVPPGLSAIADEAGRGATVLETMGLRLTAAFAVGALIQFGREMLDDADKIQKMSDATSMSTIEVQRLNYVASQSGVAVAALASASQNLEQRLGDDDKGAAGALRRLNINADQFKRLTPYQEVTQLGDAIAGIKDPTEQAAIAADLFGKNWKEILPAIKAGMVEVGAEAPVMSDKTIKSLDAMGDRWEKFKLQMKSVAGGLLEAITSTEHLGVANDGLKDSIAAIPPIPAVVDDSFKRLKLSATDVALAERELKDSAEASMEANKKAAAEAKAWAVVMGELNTSGVNWRTTLETIDGQVAAAVRVYLDAGVAQGTLASAYALTAVQVKAVAAALAEEKAQQVAQTQAVIASILAEVQAQNLLNAAYGRDAQGAIEVGSNALATYQSRLASLQATQVAGTDISARSALLEKQYTDALLEEAVSADKARDSAAGLTTEAAKVPPTIDAGNASLAAAGAGFAAYAQGATAAAAAATEFNRAASFTADLVPKFGASGLVGYGSVSARATGGPVNRGSSYIVGENGPELFTPKGDGMITPAASGSGGRFSGASQAPSVVVSAPITINGSVLGNRDEIARVVVEALTSRLKGQGVRL